jgi:hypothetical protein
MSDDFVLQISSIFEYRIGDIDLETCNFGAWFPTPDRALPKTYEVSAATSEVDVWLLDAKVSQSFAAGSLTWSNKPSRKQFLGRLKINPGGKSTLMGDAYYCATGSMQFDRSCVIQMEQIWCLLLGLPPYVHTNIHGLGFFTIHPSDGPQVKCIAFSIPSAS